MTQPADDITAKNVRTAIELDHKHDQDISKLERIAIKVNDFAGSVAFIIWHFLIFGSWMAYNYFAHKHAFDPYPFTFLTMTVSLESIFLSALLLIAQNRISNAQDQRYKLDLQINLLAEQENTLMMRVIDRMAKKMGVDASELQDYLDDTKPDKVAEVIEQVEKEAEEP